MNATRGCEPRLEFLFELSLRVRCVRMFAFFGACIRCSVLCVPAEGCERWVVSFFFRYFRLLGVYVMVLAAAALLFMSGTVVLRAWTLSSMCDADKGHTASMWRRESNGRILVTKRCFRILRVYTVPTNDGIVANQKCCYFLSRSLSRSYTLSPSRNTIPGPWSAYEK